MGIYRSDIASLRKNIEDNKGKKIIIKEAPGKRSKPQEKSAIIQSIYKDYFSVKFDETDRVGSYNYTDFVFEPPTINIYLFGINIILCQVLGSFKLGNSLIFNLSLVKVVKSIKQKSLYLTLVLSRSLVCSFSPPEKYKQFLALQ